MKRSKVLLGFGALAIAISSAFATHLSGETATVWFDYEGHVESTQIPFVCVIGEPTCIGENGRSEGRQLYAYENLTMPLER